VKIAFTITLSALLIVAYSAQMARWLRVLQREHYDPTSLLRFLVRWSSPQRPSARAHEGARPWRAFTLSHLLLLALIATVILRRWDWLVIVVVVYGVFCPVGLSIRGRTSKLEWTRRLRTTALVAASFSVVVAGVAALAPNPYLGAAVMVLAVNPVVDLVTRALGPREDRMAQGFVDQAVRRLAAVKPRIVAITEYPARATTWCRRLATQFQ
jgi:UDP-N-acetylmuramoyl-tripeptide--D-alanyl-D-alanine ligase